jgi:phospholipase D1/2
MGKKGALDPRDDSGDESTEKKTDAKRKFEAQSSAAGTNKQPESTDSVAKNAMKDQPNLADEKWEGPLEGEVENWIQEELYIHGKVLIADDKTVICGSSNLNDRSQLGIHDSELSIVMTDTKTIEAQMDGKPYEAGYHAATLRRYLWREHLGLLLPQEMDASKDPNAQPPHVPNNIHENEEFEFVADPLSNKVWEMWTSRASRNTEIFRQLFHADPDDYGKSSQSSNVLLSSLLTYITQSKLSKTTINSFHQRAQKQVISTIR